MNLKKYLIKKITKRYLIRRKNTRLVGKIAFFVGVFLAILFAIIDYKRLTLKPGLTLIFIGIIIGIVNIRLKERESFLIAAIALFLIRTANLQFIVWYNIGNYISSIINNLVILIAPAALVVALESIYSLASER